MSGFFDMYAKHKEGILYLIFGGLTVLVSWATYAVFVQADIGLNISNILSWICAVSFAFVSNKWLVFRHRSLEKKVIVKEIGSFFFFRIVTGAIAIIAFPVLIGLGMDQSLFGVECLIARIAVSMIEIVLNYVASKFVVFKQDKNENAL